MLHGELYPRALPFGELTDADRRVHTALIHQQRRSADESIDVRFESTPVAAVD